MIKACSPRNKLFLRGGYIMLNVVKKIFIVALATFVCAQECYAMKRAAKAKKPSSAVGAGSIDPTANDAAIARELAAGHSQDTRRYQPKKFSLPTAVVAALATVYFVGGLEFSAPGVATFATCTGLTYLGIQLIRKATGQTVKDTLKDMYGVWKSVRQGVSGFFS